MVRVVLLPEGRVVELGKRKMRVDELLRELGLSVESAVVLRGDEPLFEWEVVGEDEEVRVMRAVSGG